MNPDQPESHPILRTGGCHCGAVRFEANLDVSSPVSRCNCTLCVMRVVSGARLKPSAFRLLSGEDRLGDYSWGAESSHFFFCKQCGIHVFGRGDIPELGGAYVSVNVNCLDDIDPASLRAIHWDGRHNNWHAGPRDIPWPVHA
jgi:hypothetical protein